jgi:hypothetical protein
MERLAWVAEDHTRLVYHLPKPMPDGRSQLYLTPLELLDRLVSAQINLTLCKAILGVTLQSILGPSPDFALRYPCCARSPGQPS